MSNLHKNGKCAAVFMICGMLMSQGEISKQMDSKIAARVYSSKSDNDRFAILKEVENDKSMSGYQKFNAILLIALEMRESGPFHWENFRSQPNWDQVLGYFVSRYRHPDPCFYSWYNRICNKKLLDLLIEKGYYKKDGIIAKNRTFTEGDKKLIIEFAKTLYHDSGETHESEKK